MLIEPDHRMFPVCRKLNNKPHILWWFRRSTTSCTQPLIDPSCSSKWTAIDSQPASNLNRGTKGETDKLCGVIEYLENALHQELYTIRTRTQQRILQWLTMSIASRSKLVLSATVGVSQDCVRGSLRMRIHVHQCNV